MIKLHIVVKCYYVGMHMLIGFLGNLLHMAVAEGSFPFHETMLEQYQC
jgi:hypothetical protein